MRAHSVAEWLKIITLLRSELIANQERRKSRDYFRAATMADCQRTRQRWLKQAEFSEEIIEIFKGEYMYV